MEGDNINLLQKQMGIQVKYFDGNCYSVNSNALRTVIKNNRGTQNLNLMMSGFSWLNHYQDMLIIVFFQSDMQNEKQ